MKYDDEIRTNNMKYNETLSEDIINAWQMFANTSYNASTTGLAFYDPKNDSMFKWIEYSKNSDSNGNVINFDENMRNVGNFRSTEYRNGVCTFWEGIDYDTRFNLCSNSMYY